MYRKFIWTSAILAFLWGTNSVMGMDDESTPISRSSAPKVIAINSRAPGPEEWKDSFGKTAPASVRKAADSLWKAVEDEGKAAVDAGWGIHKKQVPSGLLRVFGCLVTCGITECERCCSCCSCGTYEQFYWSKPVIYDAVTDLKTKLMYDQKEKEANKALDNFLQIVNESVVTPEDYIGDAKFCKIGPWIEDGSWILKTRLPVLYSGRRDLRNVPEATRSFVNAHGGWIINHGTMNKTHKEPLSIVTDKAQSVLTDNTPIDKPRL